MSESTNINALLNAGHVPTVPVGGQVQFNPLAAITQGNQAAQAELTTRGMQAQQAIGQILQQSTDENGNVDYQKAHRMAAAAGPVVQMGMMSMAKDASLLRGQQINNASALHSFVGNLAVSGVQNPSDENWDNIRSQAVNAGMPANGIAEIDRIRALPSDQRPQAAFQHVVSNLDALQRLHIATGGAPVTFDKGNTVQGGTQNPITGALSEAGPPVAKSMTPGQGGMVDAVIQTPQGPMTIQVPYQQAFPGQVTPAAPGSGGGGGGGAPSVTPPPPPGNTTVRKSTFPPPPPIISTSPAPSSTTPAPTAPGGATPTPTPTPAATPAPTTPAPTASSPVIQTPAGPAIVKSAIPTQEQELDISGKHAGDARARTLTYQRDIQPIEGAITALAGADTGKASDLLNNVRGYAQDVSPDFLKRMLPTSLTDPVARKNYEEANKYLTAMQLQAPGGARSDVGTATAGAASPNVHISNAAAREVALAILAQRRLEHAGTMLFNQSGKTAGEFDRHLGDWNTQIDPRAFVVDKMTPQEKAAYVQGLGGVGTPEYQKYKKSYTDAVTSGVVPQPPAPDRRSMMMPPPMAPRINSLSLAG